MSIFVSVTVHEQFFSFLRVYAYTRVEMYTCMDACLQASSQMC